LIDEVNKTGQGINGDLASALLEMLDPELNNSFLDYGRIVGRLLLIC
jgi:ATP-dependent Lon protease